MTSHWKAVLGVVLIFILGFASGAVCSSIVVHRKLATFLQQPGATAQAALERRLTHRLDLDEIQNQQIHAIFQQNLQARRDLNRQIQPQVRMANLQTFEQINAILRPEQRDRFRENVEEFRNRFGKAAANAEGENLPPTAGTPAAQH